jgi:uncharacterized protein YbjT (DUF2867 family)/ketosteroid isomerase-like protein
MTNKILVTGATGNIGRHVVAGLRERGADVTTLSRATGGDLTKPETLPLSDVDTVFLLWPFLSSDGIQDVVDVIAKHARRVVYVSALSVRDDVSPEENGVWGQVEDAIRRSDLEWTFLRVGGLATNALAWTAAVRAGQPVRLPYPEAARSLIHERDVADVAVRALTEDGHTGKAYGLTGPETITQAEQVRILGTAAGRPAQAEEISREEARVGMLTWASPEFADGALDYWRALIETPEPVTNTVQELTGHPARTFAEWAHDHLDPAEQYVSAFRAGRKDDALTWFSPDTVRVAPLEYTGELRGMAAIMANAQRLTKDLEIHAVRVDGPYPHDDRFAVRFTFDQTHTPTGRRATVTKMCLYTVAGGAIVREEVFYFDAPLGG